MIKTEICVSFGYGVWKIQFKKEFELSFAPFYGMILLDNVDGHENIIELKNNNHMTTSILYDVSNSTFNVDVRNVWKQSMYEETIDDILELFSNTKWTRLDTTDINKFKEIMSKNNKLKLY